MASKIRIAARLRPSLPGEVRDDAVSVLKDETGFFITVVHPRDASQHFKFPFSSCYDQNSKQEEIYENDVKPLLDIVLTGVTVTVFAYGVTSSGKTHTIQGTKAQPGIIPRVVNDLFRLSRSISAMRVSLSVSYMEIYKEDAYDLLVERESAPKLPIRENEAGQVFVANLSELPLNSVVDFDRAYAAATKRRTTGPTNLNRGSSRSHAILTLHVHMTDVHASTTLTGKINLVDLAGSENNKLTGNDSSRMAESAAINKSLSVLGQVVHALNQGASRIPYRNSKLTRILQDALGGSAVGLLICNLAPGAKFRQDTWNTLNFATRTKEIENKPVVNIRDLQPAPKPHFAALVPQPQRLPSANVPSSSRQSGRPSLLPTSGSSKLPAPKKGRVSSFGLSAGAPYQSFRMEHVGNNNRKASGNSNKAGSARNSGTNIGLGIGMTEEEIDERISKAVEIEVARRLKEHERRQRDEEKEAGEQQSRSATATSMQEHSINSDVSASSSHLLSNPLPSGVLTPLLKRHEDLDSELKRRLLELEARYEHSNKEAQFADVLSPVSKKKTGRAYVALARAHSEKGNLQTALDLYKKAQAYVPGNIKLKQRILDIQYAVDNKVEFKPQPKKKKAKGKRSRKIYGRTTLGPQAFRDLNESNSDIEGASDSASDREGIDSRAVLKEKTNSPQKCKRSAKDIDTCIAEKPSSPKKQKKDAMAAHSGGGLGDMKIIGVGYETQICDATG